MTDPELEAALRRLGRAIEPPDSMTSEVMGRIGRASAPHGGVVVRPQYRMYRAAAFFVASAACVGGLLLALHVGREPAPRPPVAVVPTTQPEPRDGADAAPRFVDYQHAYSRSAEAFEALLQQRPSEPVGSAGNDLRVADSLRPDSNLYQ